jgi:hypothetical protein
MPQSSIIPTHSTLTQVTPVFSLLTEYVDPTLSGIIIAFISEVIGGEVVDTIPFIEGEGGITYDPAVFTGSFAMSGPDLVITALNASDFSVDTSTGELQYTY